jgi:hypothetical protein
MVATELGKSRLLTEQVGRTDLPAPASVPAAAIARERALVGQLVASDTVELAALNGAPKITPTSPEEAARMRRELNASGQRWSNWARRRATGWSCAVVIR